MELLKSLWRGWVKVAHTIGKFNTAVILSLVYLLILPFFSLWRLKAPLGLKAHEANSNWIERPLVDEDPDRFTHPY